MEAKANQKGNGKAKVSAAEQTESSERDQGDQSQALSLKKLNELHTYMLNAFDQVIVNEAHKLKYANTKRTHSVKLLKTESYWFLSATIMINKASYLAGPLNILFPFNTKNHKEPKTSDYDLINHALDVGEAAGDSVDAFWREHEVDAMRILHPVNFKKQATA